MSPGSLRQAIWEQAVLGKAVEAGSLEGSFGLGAWSLGKGTRPGNWVCHQAVRDKQFAAGSLNTQAVWARKLWQAVWEWQRGDGSDLGMAATWEWQRAGKGNGWGLATVWEWQLWNGSLEWQRGNGSWAWPLLGVVHLGLAPLDVVHLGLALLDVVHLGLAHLGVARLGSVPLCVARMGLSPPSPLPWT